MSRARRSRPAAIALAAALAGFFAGCWLSLAGQTPDRPGAATAAVATPGMAPFPLVAGTQFALPTKDGTVGAVALATTATNEYTLVLAQGNTLSLWRAVFVPAGPTPAPVPVPDPTPTPTPDPTPGPEPTPTPDKNPHTPDAVWQPLTANLVAFRLSRDDATRLASVYAQAANVVETGVHAARVTRRVCVGGVCRDMQVPAAVTTTDQLRAYIVENGTRVGIRGKYQGLAAAMDGVFVSIFGLEVRPLDRGRAVAALRTIAWQVWEQGKP